MQNSLVIYEGKYGTAKKAAEMLGLILGNTMVCPVETAPQESGSYQALICVFSFYGPDTAKKTKEYLKSVQGGFTGTQIALVGVGLSEHEFPTRIDEISAITGKKAVYTGFVCGELRISVISEEDLQALKRFEKISGIEVADRGNFDADGVIAAALQMRPIFKACPAPMEPAKLHSEIEHFIEKHNTLALATSAGGVPRCTPLEYLYADGNFYIITEGGRKFAGVLQNKKASIGIFDAYQDMGTVRGLQVTADAELVPLFSDEYIKVFEKKGLQLDAIQKLPIHLYLLKLKPNFYEFLNGDFRKDGYDAKQEYRI